MPSSNGGPKPAFPLYRYIYAPDGTPLALTKGYGEAAVTYSYHCDAHGSVVALTNPAGSVVVRYRYAAFGRVTYAAGSDAAIGTACLRRWVQSGLP